MPEFVHLHNHSDYSLLDGAQTVESIIRRVKELGMDSVALTEHGNLFSAIKFYATAKKEGIKPIIGCELYVSEKDRFDRTTKAHGGWGYSHFLLLVQNRQGYNNLMKLVSLGYLEGFYYRPRVDKELLRKYNEGLIALTACIKGEVQKAVLTGNYDRAKRAALEFKEMYPERFYLEVQNHGLKEEMLWTDISKKLSEETGIPRVATNDTHYAKKEHSEAHDALLCIGMGKEINDPNRRRYGTKELYIKSSEEMAALFPNDPEVLENTLKIADMCNLEIDVDKTHLPFFPIPENVKEKTPDEYLAKLVFEGIRTRYGKVTDEIEERANHELGIIKSMGFAGYFLIVQDFVHFAKCGNIPVGPGRGSAAGSLVAYALKITDIDPLKYSLIFERFLNPERISMPDIDIDFCDKRRCEVIEYIKERYGSESVTQIITFGKLKARAVIRDVGRALSMPLGEVDRIAKMIPEVLRVTLESALAQSKELRDIAEFDEQHRKLFEYSRVLEGMNRHASTHAAGVVIAPGDLMDYVPLYKSSNGDVTTQYDMKCLDQIGLLKIDFLGLRNLTVINDTTEMIREKGEFVDISKIPENDKRTLSLFGQGKTIGIFQFESAGMRDYLKKLKPSGIEDLIAMNALYRPGPMEMIDDFIRRKRGKSKIKYQHPSLEPILKDTYGIIVYQEQVMQIASKIAGFSLAKADLMRRAMGKKQHETMKSLQKDFVDGAIKNNIDKTKAEEIFALIQKFASYGFNRSHSAAYAVLAYQTGYLKSHFPIEFMAANLTSEMDNTNRIVILSNEVRAMGSDILPPDINYSEVYFAPEGKAIRYGLNAIKNVGEKAASCIVAARKESGPFKSFFNFISSLDLKAVNRKVLESIVASGAADSLDGTRAQKYASIDNAMQYAQHLQAEKNNNQVSLFSFDSSATQSVVVEPELPKVLKWSDNDKWTREKNLVGMYLTGHPLLQYSTEIEAFSNYDFTEPVGNFNESTLKLGGMVSNVKVLFDKKNRQMAFFKLESLNGNIEVMAFADVYEEFKDEIRIDNPMFVQGKVSRRGDFDAKIIAEDIKPLEGLRDKMSKRIHVRIEVDQMKVCNVEELKELSEKYKGDCSLIFHIYDQSGNGRLVRSKSVKVSPKESFLKKLRSVYGEKNIWID